MNIIIIYVYLYIIENILNVIASTQICSFIIIKVRNHDYYLIK